MSTLLLNYSVVSCVSKDFDASAIQSECVNIALLLLDGIDDPESKFRTLVSKQFLPISIPPPPLYLQSSHTDINLKTMTGRGTGMKLEKIFLLFLVSAVLQNSSDLKYKVNLF